MLNFNDLQNITNAIYNSILWRIKMIPLDPDKNGLKIPTEIEILGTGNEAQTAINDKVDQINKRLDDTGETFSRSAFDFDYKVTIGIG